MMRQKKIEIQPVEIKFLGVAKFISIAVDQYEIGSPDIATLLVRFHSEGGAELHSMKATMLDEAFNAWGTSDEVVIDYVCQILNLTRI
jgi:hypothetical protein